MYTINDMMKIVKPYNDKIKLETILQLIEDAHGALNVRKRFRHNDINNDFVGSEDDENAIEAAADDLAKAITILKPLAGY